MINCYKITDLEYHTRGGLLWVPGEWHITSGMSDDLCNDAWLHAYMHPLVGVFMNPIHMGLVDFRLFKAEGDDPHYGKLKVGFRRLRITQQLLEPIVDQEHRQRFALMMALRVCGNTAFRAWADACLNGNILRIRDFGAHQHETELEVQLRTHCVKCLSYEEVGRNAAFCAQLALQIDSSIDPVAIATAAWGRTYEEEPSLGRIRFGGAMAPPTSNT